MRFFDGKREGDLRASFPLLRGDSSDSDTDNSWDKSPLDRSLNSDGELRFEGHFAKRVDLIFSLKNSELLET